MLDRYNLYNLEASFRRYLLAGNITALTLKNYLSDFRHFAGWVHSQNRLVQFNQPHSIKSINTNPAGLTNSANSTNQRLEQIVTFETVNNYKNYLIASKLPLKTINRRLSTLRKFCSFCISQGWLIENPAKKVRNVGTTITEKHILDQFHQDLIKQGVGSQIITNYLNDVQDFLKI